MTPLIWLVATAAAQDGDFRSYVDQARFFLRKGWYEDALVELEKARAHPDGALDPEVWYLLANVRYHLGDVPAAKRAAEKAHSQSRTEAQLQQASTSPPSCGISSGPCASRATHPVSRPPSTSS